MSNHVTVSKVENDNIILAALDSFCALVSNFVCAHLRLEVIGCNLWRSNKNSVLVLIGLFNTAVEEECYMSILLCLGNSQLCKTLVGDVLAECIVKALWLECNLYVRHCSVVLGHANVCKREEAFLSLKAAEIRVNKCTCDFSCSVRSEVVENHAVAGTDWCCSVDNCRNNKLVGYALSIGNSYCLYRVCALNAFAVNHCGVSLYNSLPAVISVHCVVSAHYCSNLSNADFLHFFNAGCYIVLAA